VNGVAGGKTFFQSQQHHFFLFFSFRFPSGFGLYAVFSAGTLPTVLFDSWDPRLSPTTTQIARIGFAILGF
jgi:hypothetical protein